MSYADFLARKAQHADGTGFEPIDLPEFLFPFQRQLVEWSIRMGRSAIFADCGLGKTPMALVWADNVRRKVGKPVLIVTPLAVSFQIAEESDKFGYDGAVSRDGKALGDVTITNYEQLEKFDPDDFAGVVCDESSAIKAYSGARREVVTEFMRTVQYRLLCTATAAPNDYIELGTSSEALGNLGHMDMLNRFFTNKQNNSATGRKFGQIIQWQLKGHAEDAFWRWVTSWARATRRPSDLGYDDTGFVLPPLREHEHIINASTPREGALFDVPANGLTEERQEMRRTLGERCEYAADRLHTGTGVAWCHLNDESSQLTKLIDGAVEIAGSDSPESKESKLIDFTRGNIRVLVTKPSIGAWGLNWQHCNRMTYFASHSYEQYYQAVRRCWRFGQTRPVDVELITTEGGHNMLANLRRKSSQADAMFDRLVQHMNNSLAVRNDATYDTKVQVPEWMS